MTITVTTIDQGPFTATGLAQTVPYTFMTLTDEEISVFYDVGFGRVLIDPAACVVTRNKNVDGSAKEGGVVELSVDAAPVGSSIYLRANPRLDRDLVWSDTGSRLKNLNEEQDRVTLALLVYRDVVSRAVIAEPGRPVPSSQDVVDAALAVGLKANKDGSGMTLAQRDSFRTALAALPLSGGDLTGGLSVPSFRSGSQFSNFPFPNVVAGGRSFFWSPPGGSGLVGATTDKGSANLGGMSAYAGGFFANLTGDASAAAQTVYGWYAEARAQAAGISKQIAAGVGATHGFEAAIVNHGTQVLTNPSNPNPPGLTEGGRISVGREDDVTDTDVSHMLSFVNANKTADKGLVIGASALSGSLEAVAMDGSHKLSWYSGSTPIAYDRADTVQRRAISTTANPTVDLIRSRPAAAAVQSGDVLGRLRAFYNDGPSDIIGGQLSFTRGASSSVTTRLTGKNTGNAEWGITVATNGGNSVDPTSANTFALGQVNSWANIYCQNALTVTSDARTKVDLGPIDEKLLRVGKALVVKAYKDKSAVEEKGSEGARIHFGLIAQEVVAAFEAEGLDAFRYGAVCSDPWMEEVEVPYEAEEPVMEDYDAEEIAFEVGSDGGAIALRNTVVRQREVWSELPLFDGEGNPVWARAPQPKSALIYDPDGEEIEFEGALIRAKVKAFEPDMEVGLDGVLRIMPEVRGAQQTYRVQATRLVTLTRREMRQRTDENGEPMVKLQLRYEPLALLMIAAQRS